MMSTTTTSFLVRIAPHVALDLALEHIESLGVPPSTRLCDIRALLGDAAKEAATQRAYESATASASLVHVVEFYLAAKASESDSCADSTARSAFNTESATVSAGIVHSIDAQKNVLALAPLQSNHLLAATANKLLTQHSSASLIQHTMHSPVLAITPHPSINTLIATGSMDGSVSILSLSPSFTICQKLTDHTKYVSRIAFSPSATYLVSAGYDWKVHIYKHSPTLDSPFSYSLFHSLNYLGAVESLVFLPASIASQTETFVVGSRNDSFLHFVTLSIIENLDSTAFDPVNVQKLSMNPNKDYWISFTPMDIAVIQDLDTSIEKSWRLAVYTDLPSGKICLYRIEQKGAGVMVLESEVETENVAKAAESVDVAAPLTDSPSNSSKATTTQSSIPSAVPIFILTHEGECSNNLVADSFSRPRCLFIPSSSSSDRKLLLAATSDDAKVILFDVVSVSTNPDRVARKVGTITGHDAIIRALCLKNGGEGVEPEDVESSNLGVSLCTGSFDGTIKEWDLRF
ncbi:WD40 repeat-like protein [Rhizoclosmatium globosum]|uniref:WD40 repeat-like protein n=1 Tax=Rhizoclosmatium globosum TaxID=329046 RepID=A0A1Y2D1X0_9FUNG|nr:WD40 repeat-like protein [Rhizoclosmatium globosum]|eukprot:ORY52575.1 WD40 repeat-like protein [Rhizoclosmatium globosum]